MSTLQHAAFQLDSGGFVVTVEAPNKPSFQALLRAINRINPDAFTPVPPPDGLVDALIERAETDDSDMGLKAGEALSYGGTEPE